MLFSTDQQFLVKHKSYCSKKKLVNLLQRELRLQLESVAAMKAELEELKKMKESELINIEPVSAKQKEIDMLKQKLKEAESKIDQEQKPWQEKLQTAAERQSEELQYLKGCGVAVEPTVDNSQSCLVTLFPDPMLSEKLLYLLPAGKKTVGRGMEADIVLHNPLVAEKHCVIENVKETLWLRPIEGAETFVNGIAVTRDTQLQHGDRLAIAGVHFFRVRAGGMTSDITDTDYDHAQRELRREKEARLRRELRAELDASHAMELNGVMAMLDAQNLALLSERKVKDELEAERNDLQARVDKEIPKSICISPYKSTFLQQLEDIVSYPKRPTDVSLLDTHMLTREVTQFSHDNRLGLEFYQEHVTTGTSLEAIIKIWDPTLQLSANCGVEEFVNLHHIIKENSKDKFMEAIKSFNLHWEKGEKPKSVRQISSKGRSIGTSETSDISVSASLEEIQKLANRVLEATTQDLSLRDKFNDALPHLQAIAAGLTGTLGADTPSKTVRFTSST